MESFLRAPQKTQFNLKLQVFANRRGRYPYRPANCSHETTVCSSESLEGAGHLDAEGIFASGSCSKLQRATRKFLQKRK